MSKLEKVSPLAAEVEEIKKLRQQLAGFKATEGKIEVIFTLPDGQIVRIPVNSKVKTRLISKEIRNYLAEEQLMKQCKED